MTDIQLSKRVINFSAGPAKIPEEVLLQAQRDMLHYGNVGCSVMEMSHRSSDFVKIITKAEADLRALMDIPDNYRVLFLQGGGSGQFSAIPCNLLNLKPHCKADYIVSGTWSSKAAKEAAKYGTVNLVMPKTSTYTGIADLSEWNLDPEASYVYYCDNETIHGIEFHHIPETNGVPLVCDMSSNILSRKVDVTKYGLIFAGAQKNIGCAGCTVVIVREDLLGKALPSTPSIFCYTTQNENNSLYNTPPTYSIYIMGLVFDWICRNGGIDTMEENARIKSSMIYDLIDNSSGFYCCPINKNSRSRMNLPFRISGVDGCDILEKKFIQEAAQNGLVQLKGHRSVGGIRVSLYNAVTVTETETLLAFMKDFLARHRN